MGNPIDLHLTNEIKKGWNALYKTERKSRNTGNAAANLQEIVTRRQEPVSLVWIDESGFMLQPLVRCTWAPRGQTPIQYSWDRRDRLSVIAALSLLSERQHLGVYFQPHTSNIHAEELTAFLKLIHRDLGRKFTLILDRYSVRRKTVRLLKEAGINWFEVEWLPPYAPDLDPVEMIWNHTKYANLANFLPDNIDQLQQAVIGSIADAGTDQHLHMSFFRYTELSI